MSKPVRIPKIVAAALVSGGMAAALIAAPLLRAQTLPAAPTSTASPAATPGMIATTAVPFYADWASSPHADAKAEPFVHWNKEGNIPVTCARCHSTPGFLDYIGADGSAPGKVDQPAPVGTVIACQACHNDKTLTLASVTFPSGIKVDKLDSSARCMTCHQGVESTNSVNRALSALAEDAVEPKLNFINVHYAAAGATLLGGVVKGGYEYPGKTYAGRYAHKEPYTTCTACHATHTVAVKVNDCAVCHKEVTDKASLRIIRTAKLDRDGNGSPTDGVAQEIDSLRAGLLGAIMDYAKSVAGRAVIYDAHAYPYFFYDTNGNGSADTDEAKFPNRYKSWTPRLMKAAYNYQFATKDPGAFTHNPVYTTELLHDSLADLGAKVKVDLGKAVRP